ncbi:hypothetical protein FQA39_LY12010 [Lamprigera yunnana]|nr:hypothetical protein FQA39_LY12010 [Lamprigera yunnana]
MPPPAKLRARNVHHKKEKRTLTIKKGNLGQIKKALIEKVKQMFSTYESSPVKKPVQVFETLEARNIIKQEYNAFNTKRAIPWIFTTPLKETRSRCYQKICSSQRELRRNQKEANALQKKDAMIQDEEKRKKREKIELKLQQVKMTIKRDKNLKLADFPAIEPANLKRTSSAIWTKTKMFILANFTNDEEEDEDETDEIKETIS